MATLYAKTAGGNWTAAGTWSNVNAGGADNSGPPSATDDVIFELLSGNVTVNGTSSAKTVNMTSGTGSYTGTLTHSAQNLTVSGSITFSAGMTYTPLETSTVTIGAACTLTSAGKLFPNISIQANLTLGDNLTFMASKLLSVSMSGSNLDLNGKTISGNSSINRILFKSSLFGTARTITINSGTFANADFRDCQANTATNVSAITGLSGNCGGNGGNFTFTTPQTNYFQTAVSADVSDVTKWFLATNGGGGAGRVPLPQDTAIFDVNSVTTTGKTITNSLQYFPFSTDFTGIANAPAITFSPPQGGSVFYGSLTLSAGLGTFTTANISWVGRLGNTTFISAGKSLTNMTMTTNGFDFILGDACTVAGFTNISAGVNFTTNGYALTMTQSANMSYTTFAGSNSPITVTGTGNIWQAPAGVFTGTYTIYITDASASSKSFGLGVSKTYNNFVISGGGTGAVNFGNTTSTINNFTINGPKTITFAATAVIGIRELQTYGQAGKNITLTTGTVGSKITLKPSTANVKWQLRHTNLSYCEINSANLVSNSYFGEPMEAFTSNGNRDLGYNKGWVFNPGKSWIRMVPAPGGGNSNLMMMGIG